MNRLTSVKTAIFYTICTFLIFECSNSDEKTKRPELLSYNQTSKIDSICNQYINRGNTVGLSMCISHDGNIVYSKGFGLANIKSKKPVTNNTIFPVASVSKLITAIATLRMVDQGLIQLADLIHDHIPEFPKQEFMDEITIEHLLRHQSGLVDHEDWFDSLYIHEKVVFTNDQFYSFLDRPLFFRPGTHYSYSNSGYALLSNILEKTSGMSYDKLINKFICEPLDLQSTGFWPNIWSDENATMGYELVESKIDTSFHSMTKGMKGDGGLASSPEDMIKIMDGLVNGKLLSETSFQKMLNPSALENISIDYGLGIKMGQYSGQYIFGHSGGYKGTGWAILSHYSESKVTFAATINTNFSPEEVWSLRGLIMPIVLNAHPPEKDTNLVIDHSEYEGKYTRINRWGSGETSSRVVTKENNQLVWDNPDTETPGAVLYPIRQNVFSWKTYPFDEFKFHEVDGEIVACSQYLEGFFITLRLKE